jgi:ETC complex I subunit conserved region
MLARIYRPAPSATQSGKAKTHVWVLEFAPAAARVSEPLMGWTTTTDTDGQVRLRFESREAAVDYARKRGIPFEVVPDPAPRKVIRAYADNFAFGRKQSWTH